MTHFKKKKEQKEELEGRTLRYNRFARTTFNFALYKAEVPKSHFNFALYKGFEDDFVQIVPKCASRVRGGLLGEVKFKISFKEKESAQRKRKPS